MIRGFSKLIGYNCLNCHYKCCASEYDLPLFQDEKNNICEKYSYLLPYFQSKNSQFFLKRGDGCPFLTLEGKCILHHTSYKPLTCQTYPLIFYKIDQKNLLIWINPCRGNSFDWVADQKYHIKNKDIEDLIAKISNRYNNYWGEEIDYNNPFQKIKRERIDQEIEFQRQMKPQLLMNSLELTSKTFKDRNIDFLIENFNSELNNEKEVYSYQILESVFEWLCWSPIGLQLSFLNSKFIFSLASLYLYLIGFVELNKSTNLSYDSRLAQNYGSLLARSILPEFWGHFYSHSTDEKLKRLFKLISAILSGDASQEKLNQGKLEK